MSKKTKEKIDEKVLQDFPGAFRVVERRIELEGRETKVVRYADRVAASVIVPILEGKIILIEQFRGAINREIYELPAGKIDMGETPIEAAKRELAEETGYESKRAIPLFHTLPSPGYTNEVLHFFAIECGEKIGQRLDYDEAGLRTIHVSVSEAVRMIRRNEIEDGKTIQGILYYNSYESFPFARDAGPPKSIPI